MVLRAQKGMHRRENPLLRTNESEDFRRSHALVSGCNRVPQSWRAPSFRVTEIKGIPRRPVAGIRQCQQFRQRHRLHVRSAKMVPRSKLPLAEKHLQRKRSQHTHGFLRSTENDMGGFLTPSE